MITAPMMTRPQYWVWLGVPLCGLVLLGGVWREVFGLGGAVIFPLAFGSALLTRRLGYPLSTAIALTIGLLLSFWILVGFIVALVVGRPSLATGLVCGLVADVLIALSWNLPRRPAI